MRWNVAPNHPSAADLAARLKTSPLVAQALLNRGLEQASDCTDFLSPTFKLLHDPALLPGLAKASERLARAIRDKHKIVIYGDYDVDGITATAILWHAVRVLGGIADFYVPHRIDEGYGVNGDAIGRICDEGAKLIVTVDCGITAVEPAKAAAARGVDLIVTDHHLWREKPGTGEADLPACYAVVHPRLPHDGPAYPNPYLCGAGVAFKLAWGAGQQLAGGLSPTTRVGETFKHFLVDASAFAALGTVADVVPLIGENRVLAAKGLAGLEKTKLRGLRALIESAGLTGAALDSYHVGFCLGPRLNASGRLGHAKKAVEMLTRASDAEAADIAHFLLDENKRRQALERQITDAAEAQARQNGCDGDDCFAVVVGAVDWHPGVVGIVASRLVERFHKPAIMVSLTGGNGSTPQDANGYSQGSGRSIPGFHLTKALEACSEHLHSYGGHEMAAGLKIDANKFAAFRDAFCRHAKGAIAPAMLVPELRVEGEAELRQITPALVEELQRLGPFGNSNKKPVWALRGVEVVNPGRMGKNQEHLQLKVRQNGGATIRCVAWKQGDWAEKLRTGMRVDLAAEPKLNEYQGRVSAELEVKDLRVADSAL